MMMRIYGLYDAKANTIEHFQIVPNDLVAQRNAREFLLSDSILSNNATDFTLVCINEFETTDLVSTREVVNLSNLIPPAEEV